MQLQQQKLNLIGGRRHVGNWGYLLVGIVLREFSFGSWLEEVGM
jgi:hypothetical protein